jgi:quercetin dioxygenase-like cupin family protein
MIDSFPKRIVIRHPGKSSLIQKKEIPMENENQRITPSLTGESLQFDLRQEMANLQTAKPWIEIGRNARTLVKHADLRIVLTVLRKGTKIQAHKAEGRTSILAIGGRIRLRLPAQTVELAAGQLLALDQAVSHDVEAREDSAFLLTIAWHGDKA